MTKVSVHIPGKVMLAGEYSVLYGGRALAATVKHHMVVTVTDHEKGKCRLTSNLWDDALEVRTDLNPDDGQPPLVSSALSAIKKNQINGATVDVRGNLDPAHGFGSSSALRLGTSIALKTFACGRGADTYWEEAIDAFRQQKTAQKRASGYDIVTQYVGGLTLYTPAARMVDGREAWPGRITTFPKETVRRLNQIFHVFVGGKGAPTTETMGSTTAWLEQENRTAHLVHLSEQLIDAVLTALKSRSGNLSQLTQAVGAHRTFFAQSPAYPPWLDAELAPLAGADESFSWKTTGAGGEDAVLLIGTESAVEDAADKLQRRGWQRLKRPFAPEGTSVRIDPESVSEVHV